MRHVIQKCLNTFKKRHTVGGARFDQLRLEALEGRMLLSGTMYVVDSLDDVVAEDGMVTLREAIEAANANASVGDAVAGSADEMDEITFDASLFESGPGTIVLNGEEFQITDSVRITGPGMGMLTLDANQESHVFTFDSNGDEVFVSGLSMVNGHSNNGGGVYAFNTILEMNDVEVSGNYAANDGGGVFSDQATVGISNSVITGNTAGDSGGGLYNNDTGTMIVVDSAIIENMANDDGGGVRNSGQMRIESTEIVGNEARDDGGGIRNNDGELTLEFSIVTGNMSQDRGGGIHHDYGTMTIKHSEVSFNSVSGLQGDGGGIYNERTLRIENSTIFSNQAEREGGGIYNESGLTISQSVIALNGAGGSGGGIYSEGSGFTIRQSTVSGNQAGESAGGIWANRLVRVDNTIVALNEAVWNNDISLTEHVGGNNLIGIDPHFVIAPSMGDDGLAGTSDDDMGDLRLSGNSLGIDAGNNAQAYNSDGKLFDVDIAGEVRVVNGTVDIGAYEYQGEVLEDWEVVSTAVTTNLDVVDKRDGEISLREAIFYNQLVEADVMLPVDNGMRLIELEHGELVIHEPVSIVGPENGGTTIDAGNESRHFYITGERESGEQVQLSHVILYDGRTEGPGGSIMLHATELSLFESELISNRSELEGGGVWSNGRLVVDNSSIVVNYSDEDGGGIYSRGEVIIENTDLLDNYTSGRGGGIYTIGDLTISGSLFEDSYANSDGGGIYQIRGYLQITDTVFDRNTSSTDDGGAIFVNTGLVEISGSTFSNNEAGDNGGAIKNDGGRIVTIRDTQIINNTAGGDGGGIQQTQGSLDLVEVVMEGNESDNQGGGIKVINGSLDIHQSILRNNHSRDYGGGIHQNRGSLWLNNSLVVENSAAYLGGGIYSDEAYMVINQSTIAGNSASGIGGGVMNVIGETVLQNSIVAENRANLFPNIIGESMMFNALVDVDPGFVKSAETGNDGEWGTFDDVSGDYRLVIDSVAVNAGDNTLLDRDLFDLDGDGDEDEVWPFDLDGNARVNAGTVDIGAYEVQFAGGDFNVDGVVDLADLAVLATHFGEDSTGNGSNGLMVGWGDGDANGDGKVDLADLAILATNFGGGMSDGGEAASVSEGSESSSEALYLAGDDGEDEEEGLRLDHIGDLLDETGGVVLV